VGRDELRRDAVAALDEADVGRGLAILLSDRRDETIPPTRPEAVRAAIAGGVSARETMRLLDYGGLEWYFLHRWTLPTYLSGLALLERHAPRTAAVLEIGCGAGHFQKAWTDAGGSGIGADLIFSHLWLARRFTCPRARLVCFDVAAPFPLADAVADVGFAHDAFHYFPNKEHVLREIQRTCGPDSLLLGHVHNAEQPNLSPGEALSVPEYGKLVGGVAYDDERLTMAALTGVEALPQDLGDLRAAPAVAFAQTPAVDAADRARCVVPADGPALCFNPLLGDAAAQWPSAKFEDEYVSAWPYVQALHGGYRALPDLQSATPGDPWIDDLIRRRVLLSLPDRWL